MFQNPGGLCIFYVLGGQASRGNPCLHQPLPPRRGAARSLVVLQDRFVLTTELQHYVAGNTQRVAKLICQKADFEVQYKKRRVYRGELP